MSADSDFGGSGSSPTAAPATRLGWSRALQRGRTWLFPIATGALLVLALPPFDISQLGWLGLLPLLFAIEDCPFGESFRRGYIAGLAFFGGTLWWTIYTTEGGAPWPAALLGTVSLVAFMALYFGAGAAWFRLVLTPTDDSVGRNLTGMLAGAAGWVTLEWLRGHLLFGGFGWNGLGVTQHEAVPLLQLAGYTGVAGVSALVCLVNIALYMTVRRFIRNIGRGTPLHRLSWEFYVAIILVCGAFLLGLRAIQADQRRPVTRQLRLALVQGNIPQTLKFEPEQKPMILDRYRKLTELALLTRPELIIWPETATPEPLRYDLDSLTLVTNLAVKAHAELLTGTIDATPYVSPVQSYNAAMLVLPDGRLAEIYRKIHLVPFGEYVPLRKILPFMKWLTPITDSFERGREFTVFNLPEARFGVVICFEDTVPNLYRQFVRRGVDFMVNLTNDGWFKTSPAAAMHLANAVFRAAETGRPLVRCTNNGVSCVVDQYGFVRMRLEPFVAGVRAYDLALRNEAPETFYTRWGDSFVGACAIVAGIAILAAWRTGRFALESRA